MSLNSVNGKSYFYEKLNRRSNKNQNTKDAFSGNLKEMVAKEPEENDHNSEEVKNGTNIQMDYYYSKAATALWINQMGKVGMSAVFECEFQSVQSSESDCVKVYAEFGFTLKEQVRAEEHKVYVEQKNEDGTHQAYEVNPLLVAEDTKNPVEQIAVEAWEKARELWNDGMVTEWNPDAAEETEESIENDFAKMLTEFHEFVKKRMKEGPPKIPTGGAEFSEEEWKQLLKKIDKDIDAYKEELRERVRKRNEKEESKKITGSAADFFAQETDGNIVKGPEISEAEAIQGISGSKQRGSSFLARVSSEKKAPYSYLKDETGNIVYKGVTFVCDDKKQQLCLGDMSNPNKVLNIPLSKGGCLRVNRDNLDDLVKAIDMFSPEDITRILRAIAQEKKLRNMELEIDKMDYANPSK